MRELRGKVMYESVAEYLQYNPRGRKLLIHWKDIPKKSKVVRQDKRPLAVKKGEAAFPRDMQLRIYQFARRHRYRLAREGCRLELKDLDFLNLPGRFLVSEDGFVTEITRVWEDYKRNYVYICTNWRMWRLADSIRCVMADIVEPYGDDKKYDRITSQKIAFFVYFFITGDLIQSFSMTYRREYRRLFRPASILKFIFKHIVNPKTIVKMRSLMEEQEYKDILKANGASVEDGLKVLSEIMKDSKIDPEVRLDAVSKTLRLNGLNPDEVKIEKAQQQNNFFGSFNPQGRPAALPEVPVKHITGEVVAVPVEEKKKRAKK